VLVSEPHTVASGPLSAKFPPGSSLWLRGGVAWLMTKKVCACFHDDKLNTASRKQSNVMDMLW